MGKNTQEKQQKLMENKLVFFHIGIICYLLLSRKKSIEMTLGIQGELVIYIKLRSKDCVVSLNRVGMIQVPMGMRE